MSHRRHGHRRRHHHRGCPGPIKGPIKQVVRGLAERFGVGRGVVIAAFVLGFVFAPLLTLLLFFGALYWVKHPEKVEDALDRVLQKARRVFQESRERRAYAGGGVEAGEEEDEVDFADLRRRFADLERRAEGMEEYVTSEEHRLDREFRRMGGDRDR